MKNLLEKKKRKTRIGKLKLFFYFILFSFFYILHFTSYFFIFVSFIIFVKLAFYHLSKMIELGWNKDFITFTKMVNGLTYGTIGFMFIFIFHAFGELGILVCLVGYLFVEKYIWIIKRQKTEKYEQSLVAVLASIVNFLSYNFFMYLWFNPLYVVVIFYGKIVVLGLLLLSIYFFSIEFKKWYNVADILDFCRNFPGYALTLFLSVVRMVSAVIVEVVCMRYGIAGGMMAMGPIGFTPSSVKVGEYVQNVVGVSEFKPVKYIEPLPIIPRNPPKNVNAFVALIANNPQGINISKFYDSYEEQYKYFQENNRMFHERFPSNFQEFVSCSRALILDAYRTEDPKFNIVITEQQVADYINTFGQPIQVKTVEKITITTIQEALEKPGAVGACMKDNMAIHIYYKQNAIEPGNLQSLSKLVKLHKLKTNVKIYDTNVLPRATPSQVQGLWDYRKEHRKYVQDCNSIMRTKGWKICASYMSQIAK